MDFENSQTKKNLETAFAGESQAHTCLLYTSGYLSPALLDELEGADLIIHAGDLTSEMDYEHLCTIAPVRALSLIHI